MIKSEPLTLFGENEYIYFDIRRLAALEEIAGKSIFDIFFKQSMGVKFCAHALLIGMQHHYPKATIAVWYEKIEDYIDKGGVLADVYRPVSAALVKSGIVVKPEAAGDEIKNTQRTALPSAPLEIG